MHPYLEHEGPIALAHRGGDLPGLENSMAAFEDALSLGYRYLETDLQVTLDGVLVAFHDPVLDRVTDRQGRIASLPWSQVAKARIGGREPIPRLEEVLASFPEAYLNLDLKANEVVAPLLSLLQRRPGLLTRLCLGSFADHRIEAVRRAFGRRACTSAGPAEVRRLRYGSLLGRAGDRVPLRADCLQIPPRHGRIPLAEPVLLAAAARRGLPVHIWTINEAEAMERLLDRGVAGIVTDRTRVLRDVLQRRGLWIDPTS